MAIAIAFPGFNDVGRSVTLIFFGWNIKRKLLAKDTSASTLSSFV